MTTTATYQEALANYVELVRTRHAEYANEGVIVEPGRSFDKIVKISWGQRSVHSFVAKTAKTTQALGRVEVGDILKAATWKAPAKHARGNIFTNPAEALTPDGFCRYL